MFQIYINEKTTLLVVRSAVQLWDRQQWEKNRIDFFLKHVIVMSFNVRMIKLTKVPQLVVGDPHNVFLGWLLPWTTHQKLLATLSQLPKVKKSPNAWVTLELEDREVKKTFFF